MKWSWRIGRPFGIDTEVHVSFLLLLACCKPSHWLMNSVLRRRLCSEELEEPVLRVLRALDRGGGLHLEVSGRAAAALLTAVLVALVVSAIGAYDLETWFLETAPVMIGSVLLLATWRRFPLTPLLCWLLAIHALVLIVGGHYTYARVPLGDMLQDLLHLDRNPYDRIGHFAQGFAPAVLAREILLRTSPLRPGKWLFFLVTCVCLAFSAFYELIEWWSVVFIPGGSPEFLGSQGDIWDAQWDMFTALIGAITAQVLLSGVHDRQLERL